MKYYAIYFPCSDDCLVYGYLTGFSLGGIPLMSLSDVIEDERVLRYHNIDGFHTACKLQDYFESLGFDCQIFCLDSDRSKVPYLVMDSMNYFRKTGEVRNG